RSAAASPSLSARAPAHTALAATTRAPPYPPATRRSSPDRSGTEKRTPPPREYRDRHGHQALPLLHRGGRPREGADLLPRRPRPRGAQRREVRGRALAERRVAVAARGGHRPRTAGDGPERLSGRPADDGGAAREGHAARRGLRDVRLRRCV